MKNYLASLAAALSVSACWASTPQSAALSKPACCVTNSEPSVSFTDKSLYQLESTWKNDWNQSVRLASLQGRVQVVALFFASCTYACPIIVHDIKRIEESLPENLRGHVGFTLITIDPKRDTPEALHAFREARGLAKDRWTLLRGSVDDTLEIAALLGVKFKPGVDGQFAHSNLITVLNAQGEIIHQLAGLNRDIEETVRIIRNALPQK